MNNKHVYGMSSLAADCANVLISGLQRLDLHGPGLAQRILFKLLRVRRVIGQDRVIGVLRPHGLVREAWGIGRGVPVGKAVLLRVHLKSDGLWCRRERRHVSKASNGNESQQVETK